MSDILTFLLSACHIPISCHQSIGQFNATHFQVFTRFPIIFCLFIPSFGTKYDKTRSVN